MTKLGLRPYAAGDDPAMESVPVSVVVLTRDEEPNIRRCLASVAWADQVVVVDSGSTDGTVPIARSLGAEVVEQSWLGFSDQREFALVIKIARDAGTDQGFVRRRKTIQRADEHHHAGPRL